MQRVILSNDQVHALRRKFDNGSRLFPEEVRGLFDTLEQRQLWLDGAADEARANLHPHVVAALKGGAPVAVHGAFGRYHACVDAPESSYFIPVTELPLYLIGVAAAQKIGDELRSNGRSQLEAVLYPDVAARRATQS